MSATEAEKLCVVTRMVETHPEGRQFELADTQASLRRLATLVAEGAPPQAVFAAVTEEVLRFFGRGTARLIRYEADGTATIIGNEGTSGAPVAIGEAWENYPETGLTATVRRTGQPARVDDYQSIPGGERYLEEGLKCAVGMPIHVNGRLWGMIAVGAKCGPLPLDTEERMSEFTDLIATALATAHSRAELMASRARLLKASDDVRRRIERDLHDGGQQHLIALALRLRSAGMNSTDTVGPASADAIADELLAIADDLREMARGIHPRILSDSGLGPSLRALGRRASVPTDVNVRVDRRLPPAIEVGAFYVVSEMLTNVAKHAHASMVKVDAEIIEGMLRLCVRDDGIGGAEFSRGSGLIGLRDRVEALGGTFSMDSPNGGGTTALCRIPTELPAEDPWYARIQTT
jgi:signal transduction histidine kinase